MTMVEKVAQAMFEADGGGASLGDCHAMALAALAVIGQHCASIAQEAAERGADGGGEFYIAAKIRDDILAATAIGNRRA